VSFTDPDESKTKTASMSASSVAVTLSQFRANSKVEQGSVGISVGFVEGTVDGGNDGLTVGSGLVGDVDGMRGVNVGESVDG